jgi:hypothetical protein
MQMQESPLIPYAYVCVHLFLLSLHPTISGKILSKSLCGKPYFDLVLDTFLSR